MITVVIADNEGKVQELLSRILGKEGYTVAVNDTAALGDRALEFDEKFFNEKKGELYKSVVGTIERRLIEHVLKKTEGNQLKAARILGINRNTLRSKVKQFSIDARKWKAA
jgi:two-component system, NtrC family, nitrogen regulation response regulator GlnG